MAITAKANNNSSGMRLEFAKRLEKAADLFPDCPPKHFGRLEWVVQKMGHFGIEVTYETIRKWFAGETIPRHDKINALARVFEVDAAWLHTGQDNKVDMRERKIRNAMSDGAVNVVAGFIQMDGGIPAFPEGDDDVIDLHAIIRGAKYDFHVVVCRPEGRKLTFSVPARRNGAIVIGMVREGFSVDLFELSDEIIETGKRSGTSITVTVDGSKLNRIESFTKRL